MPDSSEAPSGPSAPPGATADARPRRWYATIHPPVFWPSLVIIIAFVVVAIVGGDAVGEVIGNIQTGLVAGFGWYYTALVSAFVVFALVMGLSHFGDIRLSDDDEGPEFPLVTWLAMLFAAGMGIGLVFWGWPSRCTTSPASPTTPPGW